MAKPILNSLSKPRKILPEKLYKLGPFLKGSIAEYKPIGFSLATFVLSIIIESTILGSNKGFH